MAKLKAVFANPYVKWTLTALAMAAVAGQNPMLATVGGLVLGAYHVKRPGDVAP